jgi:hypothetical protein
MIVFQPLPEAREGFPVRVRDYDRSIYTDDLATAKQRRGPAVAAIKAAFEDVRLHHGPTPEGLRRFL